MNSEMLQVRRDFGRAAGSYDEHALLQQHVMQKLVGLLLKEAKGGVLLDVGCGTGRLAECLESEDTYWNIYGMDSAEAMCRQAELRMPQAVVAGDAMALPYATCSMDAAFCSLVAQWVPVRDRLWQELNRVVSPGGYVAVSLLVNGTLAELAEAMQYADRYRHVNHFPSYRQHKQEILGGGLELHTLALDDKRFAYPSFESLLMSLRKIGATHKDAARRKGLMSPDTLKQAKEYYETYFSTPEGVYATWKVLYALCRVPE